MTSSGARPAQARVAVAQIECVLGDARANVAACVAAVDEAGAAGAELVVLPECALTGYVFDGLDEATAAALSLNGPELGALRAHCRERSLLVVVGLLERLDDVLHNTALLIGPEGRDLGVYRKSHLPLLGVDRFVMPGGDVAPAVFATPIGRIGLNICYDIRFPESARRLALAGADIVAHPANWPVEAAILAEHFCPTRACENRVVLAVANRGDAERGSEFVGRSQIVAADGEVLVRAERGPAVLTADVDLGQARAKRIVREAGRYETDLFGDRRPELYGALVAPTSPIPTPSGEMKT